tara:strand:- start:393 stop:1247 length:855 start_codon:yes stop_codon:yes gene_type:complete
MLLIGGIQAGNKSNMKEKKYGVIWAPTSNIGDDIQTLAAINFLNKKGVKDFSLINRESLDNYDGEPINVIMNGWFLHASKRFPPSSKINPIFLSFHVQKDCLDLVKNNKFYFKKHEPIGCRDQATVDLFIKHGIDAYFTGCLTLFFDPVNNNDGKKYLVDVNSSCTYIPDININLELFDDFEIVEHDTFLSNQKIDITDRLELAQSFLNKYSSADLVVTTRLHCALPCRSLNTDCIFMHKRYESDPRFKGLQGVLNGATEYHNNTSPSKGELEKIQKFLKSYKT